MPGGPQPHPAAVELDGPAQVGVGHVLDAVLGQLAGQLDDRHALRARPLGDVDHIPVVVRVAVGQEDVGGGDIARLDGGLGIAGKERIDEDARVALAQLEAGVSQEADVHLVLLLQVTAEEVERLPPRALGVVLVIGADAVVLGKERVASALVELERDVGARRVADLLLQRLGVVDRDVVVVRAEVSEHGTVQLREIGLAVGHDVVEGADRRDLGVDRGGPDGEAAAEAPAHGPDAALDAVVVRQIGHGAAHVLLGLVHGHGHHLLLRLVRLLGGLAAVEVGREREEALLGEAVADLADVVVEPPPLLEDDHTGASAGVGLRQIAVGRPAIRLELHLGHESVSSLELVRQFPAHRHANQHSHPGLLGQQHLDEGRPLPRVGGLDGGPDLRLVRLAEPAALVEGVGQDALELGSDGREPLLRALESVGLGQRGHGGLQLLVREHARDTTSVKLTALSHGAGCACKLPAAELHALLRDLPLPDDDAVLVAADTADDAAVYRVADDLALVSTADFFTPIVDDAYDFGRIAAANALSDVYAMGGRPLTALNLVAWSLESLGGELLREVLRGGAEVAGDAGVAVIGGHSIDDPEPKFGMAVTGTVHPDRIVRNSTGRAGDELFLTKPVGGGVASTAMKRGLGARGAAVEVMPRLNRDAAAEAVAAGASAMTDVTGFGLLGHLHELTKASGLGAEVEADAVPAIDGVLDLLRSAEPPIAGGSRRNRDWVESHVNWSDAVPEERRWLLCDAMTSGGLLVAAAPGSGAPGVRIGRLLEAERGSIQVG